VHDNFGPQKTGGAQETVDGRHEQADSPQGQDSKGIQLRASAIPYLVFKRRETLGTVALF